ncbi:MAG: GC-type dockerin domain-anchored protein [Planctomycetota bacterium]
MQILRTASLVAAAGLAVPALAQDSVSNSGGLPGDALVATDTSVQQTRYIATMAKGEDFRNWPGTRYGIVPLIKASSTSTGFFGSLTSAFAMSPDLIAGNVSANYPAWTQQGFGVNPNENNAPNAVYTPGNAGNTVQFGATIAEFSTTNAGVSYNGVLSAVVNYNPANGANLFVDRFVSGGNVADIDVNSGETAQLGLGSIDANGNVYVRADDFFDGTAASTAVTGNNVFRIRNADRTAVVNTIGDVNDATDGVITGFGDALVTPNNMPASLAGGNGLYVGNSFDGNVRTGAATVTNTFGVPGSTGGERGSLGMSTHSFPITGGVATFGQFLQDATGLTNIITAFGIDASGALTGSIQAPLPTSITDDSTGFTFTATDPEFVHYFSQSPFRGGNGQLAIGLDDMGDADPSNDVGLLAAPIADLGGSANDDNPINAIAVARFDPATGVVSEWDLAAWIDPALIDQQPILGDFGLDGVAFTGDLGEFDGVIDGNDAPIGFISPLFNIPGAPFGPSISSPAFDSKGNLYFISAVALNKFDEIAQEPFVDFDSALIRANYNETTGGYDLELMLELGQTFDGANSGTPYQIQFLAVADSNSITSGTIFSSAGSNAAFAGIDPTTIDRRDNRALGGLVLSAEIVYDVDLDNDFDDPTGTGGDPSSLDESYNALLYIGFRPDEADVTSTGATLAGQPGFGIADGNVDLDDLGFFLNEFLTAGLLADRTTTGATLPGQPGFSLPDQTVDLDDLGFFLNEFLDGND